VLTLQCTNHVNFYPSGESLYFGINTLKNSSNFWTRFYVKIPKTLFLAQFTEFKTPSLLFVIRFLRALPFHRSASASDLIGLYISYVLALSAPLWLPMEHPTVSRINTCTPLLIDCFKLPVQGPVHYLVI
jgi:hypothetical protein